MLSWHKRLSPLAALFLACNGSPQSKTDAPDVNPPPPASSSTSKATASPATTESEAPAFTSDPTASPQASGTATSTPGASTAAPACAALAPPLADCTAAELTGSLPCEAICQRKRTAAQNRCCVDPVDIVVLSGNSEILRVPACQFVPPECANVHGHGFMDSGLRILSGSPPEVIVVEGGCEMRAMMHGYVPPGVAAWSGCRHDRYRWDGKVLAPLPNAKP
jgi:hypothetical protein